MTTHKRYRQLKLDIAVLRDQYEGVALSFSLNRQPVTGILIGSWTDWVFYSSSPAFLRYLPSGRLHKYTLWTGPVPRCISKLYNGILESALKAGYDISEKEELN